MLFKNGDLVAHYNMVFTDDGKFEMSLDEDSFRKDFEKLKVVFRENLKSFLQDVADVYGVTVKELVAEEGYKSVDEYLNAMVAELDVEEMIANLTDFVGPGVYEIEGDKLYLIFDGYEKDDVTPFSFTVDKYKLTLTLDSALAFERA